MNNLDILRRKHWIFDLDGTLTVPSHDFAAIKRQLDIPENSLILEHLSTLSPQEAAAKQQELDRIELELAQQAQAAKGAPELLSALADAGVRIGILTRNSRLNASVTLEAIGLGGFFEKHCLIGRDEAEPKPHPSGIERLLRGWKAHNNEALMVGDYLFDLQTARAANIASVHVDTQGEFSWPELTDLGIKGLIELLDKFVFAYKR